MGKLPNIRSIFLVKYFLQGYNLNNNVVDVVILVGGKKMPTMNELIDKEKVELSLLLHGQVSLVRDLFKGYERNMISRSDRLLLGTLFLNYIKFEDIGVVPIEKTSSGQQRYAKEEENANSTY